MIYFLSDYSQGAHPKVMEALARTNMEHSDGYGLDAHCEHAAEIIKDMIGIEDCQVYMMVGGTPCNVTAIAASPVSYTHLCAISTADLGVIILAFLKLLAIEACLGIAWAVVFFQFYLRCQSYKSALFVYGNRENCEETIQINNSINSYFKITESVHFDEGTETIAEKILGYQAVYIGAVSYTHLDVYKRQVQDVCMYFKIAIDGSDSLKEYMIRALKHQNKYRELKALDHISFDVHQGEVVGIIGTNGSGKSTLLKIVSGAMGPTSGKVVADKKKIQLLTLGTGFDRELTARENVYLNGAIIG